MTFERMASSEDPALLYATLGRYFTSRAVHKELGGPIYDDGDTVWVVARRGEAVAAFGAVRVAAHGVVWLLDAYVDPAHRRVGVFRRLLAHRIGLARELGAVRLRTLTRTPFVAAMLQEYGFRAYSRRGAWTYYEMDMGAGA